MKTVIEAKRRVSLNLAEFFKNRELLSFFIWRNFRIRYKQTAVGAAWAIFQPFILMVVFTLFFHRVAKIDTGSADIPYPIFAYAGLLFWNYFSQTTTQAANSLIVFQNVITKIYFPRLLAPLSTAFTGLIDFGFALIIYVGLLIYYHIAPAVLGLVLFLPMLGLSLITVVGAGLLLASFNIKYRDVQQALPFFIQILLFVTPVIYPVSLIPAKWQLLAYINPMTGVIDTIRASWLKLGTINWLGLEVSILSALVLLIAGLLFFRRREREIADYI